MAKRSDNAGSTTHDGVIRSNQGPRGEPETVSEVKGRAQQALKETRSDDGCMHWDQMKDSQPADDAAYRRKGTSGTTFVEGSGSLKRELPYTQWDSNYDPEHPYNNYDHSPMRGDKRDPVPQPSKEPYYVGARNSEAPTNTTRATKDSEGRVSTPDAEAFWNKDEKKQGINPGDRAEHTSAATDPQRRETSVKVENKVLDCEQTERSSRDALLKQLGRNGYGAN